MKDRKMEILAPAGDMDMLRAAVFSGADCVYLGVRGFNARHGAANFGRDELAQAVAFCHARSCRVYAAVNTLVLPGKQEALTEALDSAANAGCDAVIVQDLFAAALARERGLVVHASTQMSVHSLEGVRMLAKMGFSRAILSRELSLEEIAYIGRHTPIELEVFVHGALCVSVSGQCYASATLGGRSANRGACAGTCRLPFAAQPASIEELQALAEAPAQTGNCPAQQHHLSLKDLSVLDALPKLAAAGVCSAKIEGRLRGPEYTAVVVDSAIKVLNGEQYDKELLLNVFSRSGFTDGWLTGKNDGDMFGIRQKEDANATKAALPKARALYRRERPRVPVEMTLEAEETGGVLVVSDGAHRVEELLPGPFVRAAQDAQEEICQALGKTGGTPFYIKEVPGVKVAGLYVPTVAVNAARRAALEKLLALRERLREAPAPGETVAAASAGGGLSRPQKPQTWTKRERTSLRARFEHVSQMPPGAADTCDTLLLPLFEAQQVPEALRAKTLLWLPRVLFGALEGRAAKAIEATRTMGFAGYEANNLAHLHMLRGLPISGGFGLNAANNGTLVQLARLGCQWQTLSFELSFAQMREMGRENIQEKMPVLDALCYGHLPLFLTRACPLKLTNNCANCPKAGILTDRKGARLPLLCRDGARNVYNPVPLWMAPELKHFPAATATLYFTVESPERAQAVLDAFEKGFPSAEPFTRGLYHRGSRQEA